MAFNLLNQPVASLPQIGPTYSKRLAKLNIFQTKDLLYHFPFRYDDLSHQTTIDQIKPGSLITITGQIIKIQNIYTRTGKVIQKAVFTDGSGYLNITWFNQSYLIKTFTDHPYISLSGKMSLYQSQPTLVSPQYEIHKNVFNKPDTHLPQIHTGRLVPVYHETYGISSKWLRSRIVPLLNNIKDVEWLPIPLRQKHQLIPLHIALKQIHYPNNQEILNQSIHRLKFDELLLLQLVSQIRKNRWQSKHTGYLFTINPEDVNQFTNSLKFSLTSSQTKSLNEIIADLSCDTPMNRLLQGDVGCGKTVIATAAMYFAYLNRKPSALIAPTEILAQQHAQTIQSILAPLGVKISLQTKSRHDSLKKPQVIIGTHALFHRQIPKELGLIVIDEQHRFGVEQRQKLLNQPLIPHVLSMSATPIPRTIALTLYNELDISLIDQLPFGRKPVKTWVIQNHKRSKAYQWIRKQIDQFQSQVFIVCPLIEDSTTPQLDQVKAVQSQFKFLSEKIFPDLRLSYLHGRMSSKDKEQTINDFKNHKTDILVTTPVIEVGIDIKNATIMVIEGADRFGLAQLHQLRGRVGRGVKDSFCLLFTSNNQPPSKRIQAMETVHSGFRLSELDLSLRGPGEVYGLKQSGYIDLKIASLTDQNLLVTTHQIAKQIIENDPHLTHYPKMKTQLLPHLDKMAAPN